MGKIDRRMRINLKRREPTIITRADRAREAGQWQLAAGLYRMALDRNPRNPPIWIQYGHALKESGNWAEAETAYRTAIVNGLEDADAYLQLGHALKLQGKMADAKTAYLRAMALDPSSADAARELTDFGWPAESLSAAAGMAMGHLVEGGEPAATGLHEPALRHTLKGRRESIITRADRALAIGQYKLAARLYRKALDRNPKRSEIWVQLGHALKELGNPTGAETAYRAASARNPAAADPHLQLG